MSWDSEFPELEGTLILPRPSTGEKTPEASLLRPLTSAERHRLSTLQWVPGFIFLSLNSKAQNNTVAGLQSGSTESPNHLQRRHRTSPAQQSQYAVLTGTSITGLGLQRAGAAILKGTVSEARSPCSWSVIPGPLS